jgi:hypothetical protein
MSRKLSAGLGAKVEQAKQELAYDSKMDAAQEKERRKRVPKNFTIAKENAEWIDRLAMELSLERGEKISSSSFVNAVIDAFKKNGVISDLRF